MFVKKNIQIVLLSFIDYIIICVSSSRNIKSKQKIFGLADIFLKTTFIKK